MIWLKRRKRDKRGLEIQHLVPDMLRYVSERFFPQGQYCVVPDIKYSFPPVSEDDKATIPDMKKFTQEAEKDMGLYDSAALENTYYAWEKDA